MFFQPVTNLRIFWVTGSAGDCMHQIAAIEYQFRHKKKVYKKSRWYVIVPKWAEEFRFLVSSEDSLAIISIYTKAHNILSRIFKSFPHLRFACVTNHLYNPRLLSLYGMQVEGEPEEQYSPFQKTIAIVSGEKQFSNDSKFIWGINPSLCNFLKEQSKRLERNSVLINPLSHTHLGFSVDIWKSIAEIIKATGFAPVFTLGKSISKSSFGYSQAISIGIMAKHCGFSLIRTSPAELIVLGRLARYVISGMGGSCNLVHDFRLDPQLRLGDERNCIILWSNDTNKFHNRDTRKFIINDYDKSRQQEIFTRSSQKDSTYRHFVELQTRLVLSEKEQKQIRNILSLA